MFGFFKKRDKIKRIEEETKKSFENIKQDFSKVGKWIEHFDGKNDQIVCEMNLLKEQMDSLIEDINDVKEAISLFGGRLSKQPQTAGRLQTAKDDVQTAVQTAVQTSILSNLTLSERSIVLALLYSDLKLSYEDLAVMLGKDKSTVRGQINAIKQKSEGLIVEQREPNGKKRVFIPEEMAKLISKSVKVRVKRNQKGEKEQEK